tara:strand:- start:88 stop:498 length:411 start_codon:yes stop_codon:yes gene_type:complete
MFNSIFKKKKSDNSDSFGSTPVLRWDYAFPTGVDLPNVDYFDSVEELHKFASDRLSNVYERINDRQRVIEDKNETISKLYNKYDPYIVRLEIDSGTKFYVIYDRNYNMVEAFEDKVEAIEYVRDNTPELTVEVKGS